MAKRKLYGAALAAHQKRIGRSSSTALARRPSQAMAKTKTRKVYVPAKAKRRRSGSAMTRGGDIGSGVSGAIATLKKDTWDYGGGIGYGYLTRNDSINAVEWRQKTLDKLPTSAKLGKPLSHGLVLLGAAALMPRGAGVVGIIRKALGHLSHAALMRAADNFGAAGGNTDAFAAMAGDGDGGDFSGAIDVEAD
jgi:hypothetical protein